MAQPQPDLDDELPELPHEAHGDDESVGVEDAEELMFQELDLGSEDVGLDAETAGNADFLATLDEDESEDDPLDDSTLSVETDIDADEEEQGWLEESDGASEVEGDWGDTLPDDLGDELGEDGGEEGVDDPLLDGLPEDAPRARRIDDEDDAEGFEDDGLDEFAREIGGGQGAHGFGDA